MTWQAATVASVTRETASVVTIELDPPHWPDHRAGQHLDAVDGNAIGGLPDQGPPSMGQPHEDST